jgi:hypothetical protein
MRRTEYITITDEGRDKGKVFLLTEMPASRAEKWAARALLALAKSGVEIPPDMANAGLAGIAVAGMQALGKLDWEIAEILLDELMGCVQFIPDPSHKERTRPLHETDIEEVTTRLKLKGDVFTLHTGFSLAVGPSTTTSKNGNQAAGSEITSNTKTSPDPLARSSAVSSRA